jgi:hypothetical protein
MDLSRSTTALLLSVVLATVAAVPAGATPLTHAPDTAAAFARPALTDDARPRIAQKLEDFDVPTGLRPGLLTAAERGGTFLSATDAQPTAHDTVVLRGLSYDVARYADGSFIATSVETPGAQTGARTGAPADAISGCSQYTGAGVTEFSNCLIIEDTPSLTLQFRASYYRSAGASGIDSISDWDIQAAGGSCQFQEFDVIKARSGAATGPARARLRCYANLVTGIASSYPYLDLVVDRSGARTEANF